MTRTVLLNNLDHAQLRVRTERSTALGDGVMFAVTFPAEFRDLQAHYPLVFRKLPDGTGFEAVALFGFEPGQNLFLGAQGWDAGTLPLAIERLPFYIGQADGEQVLHVDLDSPRLSQTQGEALFLPHGGSTDFLQRMGSVLQAIHQGLQGTPPFFAALLAHDLLEPFVFEYERPDGVSGPLSGRLSGRLSGFYTVHEERLRALPGEVLAQLSRAGHLQAAYMALASLSQLRVLLDRQAALDSAPR